MQYDQFSILSDNTSIDLKNNYTYINDQMFYSFKNLKTVYNISSLLSIDHGTFDTCNNLNQIILDNNLEYIGHNAFDETNISSINIPLKIKIIHKETFINCKNLKYVTFDNNSQLETIDYSAFCNCTALLSIKFPKNLKYINDYAFGKCYNLETVLIPHSIKKIGYSAFANCVSLKKIIFY